MAPFGRLARRVRLRIDDRDVRQRVAVLGTRRDVPTIDQIDVSTEAILAFQLLDRAEHRIALPARVQGHGDVSRAQPQNEVEETVAVEIRRAKAAQAGQLGASAEGDRGSALELQAGRRLPGLR